MKGLLTALVCIAGLPFSSAAALAEDDPVFDIGVEIGGATDYMDSGLTNSDHDPVGIVTISPSYGIFYGTIFATNIDYGTPEPKLETKFAIGAAPSFGDHVSMDFNLARRIKFDDPAEDRWLPYVTGTYTFDDHFNVSLGAGYYLYDDAATPDYFELYAGSTVTLDMGAYATTEFYWEPDSDGFDNAYYAVYGTVGIPFLEKFEAVGKIGFEIYEDNITLPSYVWYEARLKFKFNDHIETSVAYHGNNLSDEDCLSQAYTDCGDSVFATVTLKGNLSDLSK